MEDDGRLLARNELQFKDGKALPDDYKKGLREPSPEERQKNSTSLQPARPTDCSFQMHTSKPPNPNTLNHESLNHPSITSFWGYLNPKSI